MVLEFQRDHQKEKEMESPKEIISRKERRKEKVSPPKERRVSSMKRQRSGTQRSPGGGMITIGGVQKDGKNME